MSQVVIDGIRYIPEHAQAARVSIHGMYDMHLFHRVEGKSVSAIIAAWEEHNSHKHPAIVGDREVDDMGQSSLCPATVLDAQGKEIRRVGEMVFTDYKTRLARPEQLEAYRKALSDDPDIPRLLAEQAP